MGIFQDKSSSEVSRVPVLLLSPLVWEESSSSSASAVPDVESRAPCEVQAWAGCREGAWGDGGGAAAAAGGGGSKLLLVVEATR